MKNLTHFFVIGTVFFVIVISAFPDEGRQLLFPAKFFRRNKRLADHIIATKNVPDLDLCELQCYHEPNCVSINFNVIPDNEGLHECELNDATHQRYDSHLEDEDGFVYKGAKSACDWFHDFCNEGICQSGYTNKGYRCVCPEGLTSDHCQKGIGDCVEFGNNCGNKMCIKTGDGHECIDPKLLAWFPLNATFNISEVKGRVYAKLEGKEISLAPGPDGGVGGSYKLKKGTRIKFPSNQVDGSLDVRYSMTILFWLYYNGHERNASIVRYARNNRIQGTGMFLSGPTDLQARIQTRDHVKVFTLKAQISACRWTFVAITFNHTSGEAKLWINAVVKKKIKIKNMIELSTQHPFKIGGSKFKGRITQLQIYNYPLRTEKINESFIISG